LNLSDYVKKRNGVPLGASESLRNMIVCSLGAGTFSKFWRYWNPIWSYYLGKYIFKPLKTVFPVAVSLLLTFTFCGFLHDLVVMFIRWDFVFLLTPWFFLMGLCALIGDFAKIDYSKFPWMVRAVINITIILICLYVAYQVSI
jgi:D-alanyl-lipoteichoic acid acyltransferase DltB (MBOAT superfamily)